MKKSEKIEIRISYDEKESLTRLAESEGQSVSELVRGLARKYAQLNMPRPRARFSRWHMAGLILCGVGIGSGLAFSLGDKLFNAGPSHYMVHGTVGNNGFGFRVEDLVGHNQSIALGQGVGTYKIAITVKAGASDKARANFAVCKQMENDCVQTAHAVLDMESDDSPSVWQTETAGGEMLFLVLQPVSS